MSGNEKNSLVVTNTGTFAQYQRCLMYGNWVFTNTDVAPTGEKAENHLIVASADLTKHGSFTDFPGTDWTLASDGFYYYKYPINVGNIPNHPLFNTYTGPTSTPFPGTHLEFDISVQAERYSSYADDYTSGTYVADYNKNYVKKKWNLDNVYVVNLTYPGGTKTQTDVKIIDWLSDRYEVLDQSLVGQGDTPSNSSGSGDTGGDTGGSSNP